MSAVCLCVILMLTSFVMARDVALTAGEVVEKANQAAYYAAKDGLADVAMTITDASGNVRKREFRVLRFTMPNGKDQKFYVYFTSPADVRRMAYLVWKNVDTDDDRWLWLPALSLVKRIAPGDKRSSFVGSDFVYEDVSGRGINEDKHELIEQTEESYVLKSTPRNEAAVEFSYYSIVIDAKTFLPRKAEYYDKNGKLYRRVEAKKVDIIEGHPTVTESVASDLKSGSKTVNKFKNIKYDVGLTERIFSERFLRRPPREAAR
ncbi:MAG: outer membrane lipoprotein-sorting protein [Kiritimatiellae bacterium]|nr:outer membrane lipoprotein-sorting protein [Kiritimatiellia bacterium]